MPDRKTILLVEDEALIAIAQKNTLEKYGYRMITVYSGEKAIEKVRATPDIDLILMDINLGKGRMDGTECAEIILKERDIPVLFLSSYTQPDIVEKTEKITSYGYVVKDSGETVLNASIKMAFKLHEANQELKEHEKALGEESTRRRLLLEEFPDGVLIIDPRTAHFVDFNSAAHRQLGYSREEFARLSIFDIEARETADETKARIAEVIRNGKAVFETLQYTRQGEVRNVYVTAQVIDIQGHPVYHCVWRDITEQNRAEEKLKQQINAIEASIDGIAILNENQDYIYLNEAHARIYGYAAPDELIGQSWRVLYSEDELQRLKNDIIPGFIQKGQWRGEATGKKKDGSTFLQEISLTALDNGGLVCVVHDITARKRAEAALKEREENYRDLFEGINDAVFVHDLDKQGLPGRFLQVNDVACSRLGYSKEELLTLAPRDITPPEEYERIADERISFASRGDILTETIHVTKDGLRIPVESNIRQFHYFGRQAALSISRDITDRKLAQDRIKNLLSEKELLLKEVHHRIKNNMNVIMGLLSLQSDTLKEPSAVSALQDTRNRVRSMAVLYDKLYRSTDFRAISAKEYLTALINEIMVNFPNRMHIDVETRIDDTILDAKILSPIGIIINELITNAMKHAFDGRDKGKILVSFSIHDKHATLVIEDNGVGIPDSINIMASAGFGMQLVNMLADQLDGSLRVEREDGARFILTFEV